MSKKLEFVERATVQGAKLAPLCREFGITRPTGRKWKKRFLEHGPVGLEEESRRPDKTPFAMAEDVIDAVLETRDSHPSWGPKKIHDHLRVRFTASTPSRSTVARILRRFGRIQRRRHRRQLSVVEKAPAVCAGKPNAVWTVDFKGWWRSRDGSRCEPLTVRDAYSRYILSVTLSGCSVNEVKPIFEALFRKYGLPEAIQCDNGIPFVHVTARAGLSRLSAWWVSLGIRLIRSRPGCPQDNGGHERMHRDIANEVERYPAPTKAAQQRSLDKWRQEFNHVRPHEKLEGKRPTELYRRSERRYQGPLKAVYPESFIVRPVYPGGAVSLYGEEYFISASLAGQSVGLEQLSEMKWNVWFHDVDCGELEVLPEWLDDALQRRRPLRAARPSARGTPKVKRAKRTELRSQAPA